MNKTLYKVIFNKRRGLMMAVAETTVREGKSNGDSTAGTVDGMGESDRAHSGIHFTLPILSFSLLFALGLVVISPTVSAAGIVADKSAPQANQATILKSAKAPPKSTSAPPLPAAYRSTTTANLMSTTRAPFSTTAATTPQPNWVAGFKATPGWPGGKPRSSSTKSTAPTLPA